MARLAEQGCIIAGSGIVRPCPRQIVPTHGYLDMGDLNRKMGVTGGAQPAGKAEALAA